MPLLGSLGAGSKSSLIVKGVSDGLTPIRAGSSALAIKTATGTNTDGLYWIDLPSVGVQQVYCIMDSNWDGGGWMMSLKATRGTTFNFDSSYWTTANTFNTTSRDQTDADAKFDVFNYYQAKDIMARWPDIGSSGGSIGGRGVWTWAENNFFSSNRTTLLNFFNTQDRYFVRDSDSFVGGPAYGQFSSQTDIRFYGFNYRNNNNNAKVRWGFGFNENSEGTWATYGAGVLSRGGAPGSDDVSGGIGMSSSWGSYSAGDRISCCQNRTGINRSARVEIYVR